MSKLEKSDDPVKAFAKLCDLLSRRDHSTYELQEKLKLRFSVSAIEEALTKAQDYNYLKDPAELAHSFTEILHNKGKGYRKILFELQKKGLPAVPKDEHRELEKALHHLNKLHSPHDQTNPSALSNSLSTAESGDSKNPPTQELRQKGLRFLTNRGFDNETIRKALESWAY